MRLKGFISIAVSVLVMLLVRYGVGRLLRAERAAEAAMQVSLAKDTVEAAKDTSRDLPLIGALGDSLRAAQRRAIQVEQRADRLDATLKLERVARERLEASVVALRATVRSDTVFVARGDDVRRSKGDSVRRAAFDLRQAPYTVHADVAIPEPPQPGSMDVRVTLDSLGLDVRISCARERPEDVREAFVTVLGPEWASVRLGRVEQAPDVCAASAVTHGGRWSGVRRFVERFGVSIGYSAARTSSGTVVAGPGLTAGFRVWP